MRIVQSPRASAILYNLLASQEERFPWLLPANICPIVPITFFKAGIPFEFVDISAETLHMDLEQAEDRMGKRRFGGLLYAHTYGEASTPRDFFSSIKSRHPEILIVDDRCLCIPEFEATLMSDVTLFSTGYAKIVDLGFGGYALLGDDVTYRTRVLPFDKKKLEEIEASYKESIRARTRYVYRDCNWLETDFISPEWHDYRRNIESELKISLAHRRALNKIYTVRLPLESQLPHEYQMWRFNIRVGNRPRILKAIFADGLFASSHYASLAGIMADGDSPAVDKLADQVINLFNDHHFDVQKAERVCDLILENYES